jgi:hypothetical protein
MTTSRPKVTHCPCGASLLTDECRKAGKCYECRDSGLYEQVRTVPDLEAQYVLYCEMARQSVVAR